MAMGIHEHPLKEQFSSGHCRLCSYSIYDYAYVCGTCEFQAHKLCVEATPIIRNHPFHPIHALSLVRDCKYGRYICDGVSANVCNFFLDVEIALSTLPDPDPDPDASPQEQIIIPFHDHELTSFYAKWKIGIQCFLCHGRIEGDGYVCSSSDCRFLTHRRCTEDRYYEDGTKVPRLYHVHGLALETSSKEGGSSIQCWDCKLDISGEYLGCLECKYFYHRSCVRLPEVHRFPTHPNHALVLFIYTRNYGPVKCQSCSSSTRDCLSYRCIDCDFALHAVCALRTLSYCEGGESSEIAVPWHEHPVLLCHRTNDADHCSGCGDNVKGLAYRCKKSNCELLLDKACVGLKSKIDHPHHPDPDHPLVLLTGVDGPRPCCDACCERIADFSFSCEPCDFSLDVKCASQVPIWKSHLHEHNLVRFDTIPSLECNRCGTPTNSPLFRCVPCEFNLHEKCMELPQTVKCIKHEHDLVLRDSYLEDNDGEYYCDICEKIRDSQLGVYVCEICRLDILYRAHIQCVLPELKGMYENKGRDQLAERLDQKVAAREEEAVVLEKKLEEAKAKLDNLRKKRDVRALSKPNEEA